MPKHQYLLKFLKQERWNILFVVFITGFVPAFFFRAINPGPETIIIKFLQTFPFFAFIYAFSVTFSGVWKRVYFITLFLLFYFPGLIILSSIEIDRSILQQSEFWVIFQSNPKEAKEFVHTYLTSKLATIFLVYNAIPVYLLIFRISTKPIITTRNTIFILMIGISLVLAGFGFAVRKTNYVIDFYSSIFNYCQETARYNNFREYRQDQNTYPVTTLPQKLPITFIVIIGESLNKNHMSLYGYPRLTNPLLNKIKSELLVFRDVISSELQTLSSMKEILTFANHEHPDFYFLKPSIIELFNLLGFKTYWIDNQYEISQNTSSGVYPKIARLSEEFFNLNFSEQDESVVKALKPIVNDSGVANKFIILHLMGSHLPYNIRYPSIYNKFKSYTDQTSKINGLLTNGQKQIINEYDNTVLYNDFVIASVIDLMKNKNDFSYVLYFSDHGEEVFDNRIFAGRSFGNITPGMYQIPFILWVSDKYKTHGKSGVNLNNPYSIDDVIHTIMDLSFMHTPDYDSTRSVVSGFFKTKVRWVNGFEETKIH